MKQTAVEWLCNEWSCIDQDFDLNLINKKIYWQKLKSVQEQAIKMEKEQIEDAYDAGLYDETFCEKVNAVQYYNETFKHE